MVSQTVDRILASEKSALEKIEAARKQSEEMLVSATLEAKAIVESALKEAKAEAARRSQANQAEIEVLLEKARLASVQEVADLRAKAEGEIDKATNTVIGLIVNRKHPTQG